MKMSPPNTCMSFVLFGIISLTGTVQAEWCYSYYDGYFSCSSGCCNSYGYEECCTITTSVYTRTTSTSVRDFDVSFWIIIIASVIGGILLLSFVVCLVAVCYCKGKKAGRVIQPHNTMQPAYTNATTHPVQHYSMTTTTLPPLGLQPQAYQPNSNPNSAETSTVNQREATTHPLQYYGMTTTTLPPPGLQPPAYQPNLNPKPAETSTANQREGIQSEPPVFGGLPGNHQVV